MGEVEGVRLSTNSSIDFCSISLICEMEEGELASHNLGGCPEFSEMIQNEARNTERMAYIQETSKLKTCISALCSRFFKYTSGIFGTHCVCVKNYFCKLYSTQKC
jgi:hypothetical protein